MKSSQLFYKQDKNKHNPVLRRKNPELIFTINTAKKQHFALIIPGKSTKYYQQNKHQQSTSTNTQK